MMLVLVLVTILVSLASGCSEWSNCPPCAEGTLESDVLAFLSIEAQPSVLRFLDNIMNAVNIIKSFGRIEYR